MLDVIIPPAASDWRATTLGELCALGGGDIQTGPFGSQLHASDYVHTGIPSVMPQNIGDNTIIEDGIARITETDAVRLSRYRLHAGDIVYSRRGDVERRAFVRDGNEGWLCGTGCLRVRLGTSADSRFMSYYLGHPDVRGWIVRHAVGATMPNLNTSILAALPVTLPPPSTQRSIAMVLGTIDDKIAVNDQTARTAFEIAASRYKQLASRAVSSMTIGDVIDLKYGKALPTADRISGDVPVYGSGGITGFHNEALVSGPGVVIGRKGTVGSVYWSEEGFFPIDTTFYVVSKYDIPMEYAFFLLRSLGLGAMNADSAVPGLNRSGALALPVRVPDESDLRTFYSVVRPMFALRQVLAAESTALAELRDALLPRLILGQIRPGDAENTVEEAI